jgi:archaellum component FlaF (FlaF/FlaG flagellin family)
MGLSTAIAGGIILVAMVYVFLVLPNIFEKTTVVQEASTEISKIENRVGKTNFAISDITTTSQSQLVRFTLSNNDDEKLWNYENFDFFITYDAYINGAKVKQTEKLSYIDPIGTKKEPVDVDSVTTFTGNCDPCTFQHEVTDIGSNKLLLVKVSADNQNVNSVTYDGQSLTFIRRDSGGRITELWYLSNPPKGEYNVVVDFANSQNVVITAMSLTGVDSSPINTHNGATGSSSTPSTSLTTTVSNAMIIDVVSTRDGPMLAGTNQHERWENNQVNTLGSGSTKDTISSGAYTMSWTNSFGSRDWAISAVALRPVNDPVLYSSQWTIKSITTDTQDPGILNYLEEASVLAKLNYPIYPEGQVIVSVSTDNGVYGTSSVSGL